MHRLCSELYNEGLPNDEYCMKYAGYDSFLINPNLMMSVPNKCASQFLNQFSFQLMGLTDADLKPKTVMYSYRSSVEAKEQVRSPDDERNEYERSSTTTSASWMLSVVSSKSKK